MKKKISKKQKVKKTISKSKTRVWDNLSELQIRSKQDCIKAFVELVDLVQKGKYKFQEGHHDKGNYFLVDEEDRGGSSFVYIVPKEAYKNFVHMQKNVGDTFLGFSMLCGKNGNKDLRVSCFGIPTSDLTRALLKS